MSGFGWLHLTDLHVRTYGTLWQRKGTRDELERDLAQIVEKTGTIDVIIITGDLALFGLESEFDTVTEGLASMIDFLEKLGSRPALLAVPGNHDLVRTARTAATDPQLWEADADARNAFFSDASHPQRIAINTAFTPFSRWFEAFRERCPGQGNVTITPGLLPGDFVATLQKRDRRFAFAGLNTAFVELAGHNAVGAIDVDPRQLETSAGTLEEFVRRHDAALLLSHHPPATYSAGARERLSKQIAPRGRFVLHLTGSFRGVPPPIDMPHGSLFVGRPFSGNVEGDAKRGYAAGRFDIDEGGGSGLVTVWPRILSFARREPFMEPDKAWPLGPLERFTRTVPLYNARPLVVFTPVPAAITPQSQYMPASPPAALEPAISVAPNEDETDVNISGLASHIEVSREKKLEIRESPADSDQPPTAPVPTDIREPHSFRRQPRPSVEVRDAKPAPKPASSVPVAASPAPPPATVALPLAASPPPSPAGGQSPTPADTLPAARTWPSRGISQPPSRRFGPATMRFAPGMSYAGVVHTGVLPARRVMFSPDGDLLVFLYADGFLKTWNLKTNQNEWSAALDHRECFDMAFSPDGSLLAVRSPEKLFIVSRKTGLILRQTSLGGPDSAGLSWSIYGIIATGEPDGRILFFDANDLSHLGELEHGFCPEGILALEFSPDGNWLVSGGECEVPGILAVSSVPIGALPARGLTHAPAVHRGSVLAVAFRPNSTQFASASSDGTIAILNLDNLNLMARLEGHTAAIVYLGFSHDGRALVSRSRDGTVIVWSAETWDVVLRFHHFQAQAPNPVFSPREPLLCLPSASGIGVELITYDIDTLLDRAPTEKTMHTTTAKVVLLGEGRSGKSCLALRLAEDRYLEQPSTHGMRFWTITGDQLGVVPPSQAAHRRELVIWDLGGQDEYRLVHPLFLADTQLAMLVFEPGRGQAAEAEVASWNDHLLDDDDHTQPPRRLLVGTKLDDEHAPEDRESIERLRIRTGALTYVPTSASNGRGIGLLRQTIVGSIDWSAVGPTSRPLVFERIRAFIDRARKSGRVVLPLAEIETEMRALDDAAFLDVDHAAVHAVASHLARQGLVALIRLSDGTRALVLHAEQISRYAGSLVLLARQSPHGVPALEIASLLGPTARFPRIPAEERLRRDQELGVLDGVMALLIEQGISFLHEGLLVFPGLFPSGKLNDVAEKPWIPAIRYEMSRPASNVYASAVAALALSRRFGPVRLGSGRADFGRPGEGLSRISIETETSGKSRWALALAFSPDTADDLRRLMAAFLEDHLRLRGVQFIEKMTIRCACDYLFPHEVVERRLVSGHSDVGCPECDVRTPLVPRQTRDGAPSEPILALRKATEQRRDESVHEVQMTMTTARISEKAPLPEIRILHLSDLHIAASADPEVILRPLLTDLRDRHEGLSLEKLDFLILSGDITNRASPAEFEKAQIVVSTLVREMGLSAGRCLIVPGNHDLDWECEVYEFKKKRHIDEKKLTAGSFVRQDQGFLVRNDAKYPERFRNFSHHFYHPLLLSEYPLEPEAQGLSAFFAAERIQFFMFNSSWEVDEYHSDRTGLSPGAISRALDMGDRQIRQARDHGDIPGDARILRFAVFHHPITGNEKMVDEGFVEQFRKNDIRAVFHGHVHEERVAIDGHLSPFRQLQIVGAGSFGAPGAHRPESVPRLYNLITVSRELQRMRVDTRCLRKPTGAWEAFAVWPGERPGEKRAYYEVDLK